MGETQHLDDEREVKAPWLRRFLVFVLPILVLVLAVGLFAAMGALKPEPEEKEEAVKAIPVLTELAVTENVTLSVSAQGEVQPRTKINLVPQVSGKITYMSPSFIEGGRFFKGDLLVRIESDEYKLRVIQAEANVAQAETLVSREVSEGEIAAKDWEDLGREGTPSALTLRAPQLAEARARLASAKAMLGEAELHLRRTSLYAPFNGRVTSRAVNQGEFVTTGNRMGEIYSVDIMDVRLPMSNQDLARAGLSLGFIASKNSPGIPVTLTANVAGQYASWDALIVRTDSGFDPKTRVLFAYAEVKDPFGKGASNGIPLAPGIFVSGDIRGESMPGTIVIPRAGLRGKDQVYIAGGDGILSIKTVQVASSDRDRVIISGGLNPGEAVVISPIRGVADGMKIDVVKRSAAQN